MEGVYTNFFLNDIATPKVCRRVAYDAKTGCPYIKYTDLILSDIYEGTKILPLDWLAE